MSRSFGYIVHFGLAATAVVALAACLGPSTEGASQAGQTCLSDADCAQGLICEGRRCLPRGPNISADASTDATQSCPADTRECSDAKTLRVCPASGAGWETQACADDEICRDGECVDEPSSCVDDDDDGYGSGCETGPDCNDSDPEVNPGMEEQCDNARDDDCDGEINENCDSCCAGGCGSGEFCHECTCRSYDSGACEYPYQPCEMEGDSGEFVCTNLVEGETDRQRRCYSTCDPERDEPDAQCQNDNAECLELGDQDGGLCVRPCTFGQGCGIEKFGCMPYDGKGEGVCLPSDDSNAVGDSCESTFDCEAGALCDPLGQGDGCAEMCRPFAASGETDCTSGHCLPLSGEFGVCGPDNDSSEGESCDDRFTTCGEDGVVCAPSRQGGMRCQQLCRTDMSTGACESEESCQQIRSFGENIGFCQ